MVLGYGIIAVPTGIVSAEYTRKMNSDDVNNKPVVNAVPPHPSDVDLNSLSCSNCLAQDHKDKAKYCHKCGHSLEFEPSK